MFCPHCGSAIQEGARFCQNCGNGLKQPAAPQPPRNTHVQPAQEQAPCDQTPRFTPQQISRNIVLDIDGKYRWIYAYSLFRRPWIFLLVWKIIFFILFFIFAFMTVITAFEGDLTGEWALDTLRIFVISELGMSLLVGISYLIYAAIMGGKYVVLFEMDEEGILHRQIDRQARKANKIGDAAFVIGAFASNRAAMTSSFAVRTEMYTSFSRTGKVKSYPRRNYIKIRETLSHNQIYVHDEDFNFVLDYILSRVPDQAKKKIKRTS